MACLDTELLVEFLRGDPEAASLMKRLASEGSEASTTSVSAYELLEAALVSRRPESNLRKVVQLLEGLEVLPLTTSCSRVAAEIHASLRSGGKAMGEFDILIAAIAMERGEPLVSRDEDFDSVRGLKRIRW